MEKAIKVVGGIGNTARQNRDTSRVISRVGVIFAIKAHAQQEPPYVLKRWKRNVIKSG